MINHHSRSQRTAYVFKLENSSQIKYTVENALPWLPNTQPLSEEGNLPTLFRGIDCAKICSFSCLPISREKEFKRLAMQTKHCSLILHNLDPVYKSE